MGPPKVATEAPTAKQGFSYISHLAPLLITDLIYQKKCYKAKCLVSIGAQKTYLDHLQFF